MTTNQISYYKAKEDERHNRAMEAETARANQAQERIKQYEADSSRSHYERSDAETQRSNLVKESQNAVTLDQGYTKLAQEQQKINETAKHNRNQEEIDWVNSNAKSKEASAKMITAQSGAELSYARAGHEYAQTALTDIEAAVEIARKNQIHAQTEQTQAQTNLINVQIPQTRAATEEAKARTYKTITETSFIPISTFSNVVRSLSLGSLL